MTYRTRSVIQMAVLLILSTLLLSSLGDDVQTAWSQSPVWTVIPSASPVIPDIEPGFSPVVPHADQPAVRPSRVPGAFSRTLYPWLGTSLAPWIAMGVVFFGGVAWALITLLSRFESDK